MAQPITWRNVDAPSFGEASRMLLAAQGGFNSGFGQLNDVLKTEQATAEANWKQVRDNNTQAFLNSINQYRTPEEYQAALQSGALDPSKFGAQIDQAAVRSALDGRLAILQDRAVKAGQFEDQQKARDAKPIVDQLSMMALSDDKAVRESAKQALGIYASNGMLPDASVLAGNMRNIEHQNVTWDQEARTFDDNLKTNAVRRSLMGAQTNQANAAAENYRASNSDERVALKAALAESKKQNEAAALKIKNSPLDAGTMDTYEGKKKFAEGLKALGITDSEVVDSIHQSFAKDFGNGVLVGKTEKGEDVRIGLPVATALAAVEGAKTDWKIRPNWLVGSGRGGRASDRVKALMSEPSYVGSLQEAMQAQGIQYRPLTASPDSAASSVAVSASSKTKTPPRLGLPKPDSGELDTSGVELLNKAIKSRTEAAQEMMTPSEIDEARKTGRLPYRIKQFLEAGNSR